MIDLHCHLLPGVDDGPADDEQALALAREQVAAGVSRAAATPHVGWSWPLTPSELPERLAALRALLAAERVPLEVVAGGELQATFALDLSDEQLAVLALGGGPYLLLEAPMTSVAVGLDRIVFALQARGHRVLLAHPERCPGLQRDPELLARLVGAGALTQVTAGALSGRFGGTVRRFALELVGNGLVHTVASDAHDLGGRPPGMREELRAAGLEAYLDWWCCETPAAVLDGGPLPEPPSPWPPTPARGARRRLGLRRR